MSTELTTEPTQLRAGDSVSWTKSFSPYTASNGYQLKYRLIGSAGKTDPVPAVASGDAWTTTFTTAYTKDLVAGIYTLLGWVEKSGERVTVSETSIQLLANLVDAAAVTDTRSHARKTLALIEAAIESYAVRPVEQLSIAGRNWTRPSLEQLSRLRSKYTKLVRIEVEKERRAKGLAPKRIVAQFPRVF